MNNTKMVCMNRKFRINDYIIAINNSVNGYYKINEEYKIKAIEKYSFTITLYTYLDSKGSTTNGWGSSNFILSKRQIWIDEIKDIINE